MLLSMAMGAATGALTFIGGKIVNTVQSAQAKRQISDEYSVVGDELKKDQSNTDIYDNETGYKKNPTVKNLDDTITSQGIKIDVDGKNANGSFMYVIDENGNLLIGTRNGGKMPHPTLIGGTDPKVQCAGMIEIRKGKIVMVNNASGHYKPSAKSLKIVEKYFDSLKLTNPEIFAKNFTVKQYNK